MYKENDARNILGRFVGERKSSEKEKAAISLVEAFIEMAKPFNIEGKRKPTTGVYEIGNVFGGVFIRIGDLGENMIIKNWKIEAAGENIEVPIAYNAATDLWEGKEDETRMQLEPGSLPGKRSALEVLSEEFVKAVKSSPE